MQPKHERIQTQRMGMDEPLNELLSLILIEQEDQLLELILVLSEHLERHQMPHRLLELHCVETVESIPQKSETMEILLTGMDEAQHE